MAEKVSFELVSPERLLVSQPVEMVIVPGDDGDFGVLPGHAPLLSTVRPGVIHVYENGEVTERIFVAGGFAEVTPERCTVLAELAMPVGDIVEATVEVELKNAREDLEDAASADSKADAERRIDVAEAKLDAVRRPTYH